MDSDPANILLLLVFASIVLFLHYHSVLIDYSVAILTEMNILV